MHRADHSSSWATRPSKPGPRASTIGAPSRRSSPRARHVEPAGGTQLVTVDQAALAQAVDLGVDLARAPSARGACSRRVACRSTARSARSWRPARIRRRCTPRRGCRLDARGPARTPATAVRPGRPATVGGRARRTADGPLPSAAETAAASSSAAAATSASASTARRLPIVASAGPPTAGPAGRPRGPLVRRGRASPARTRRTPTPRRRDPARRAPPPAPRRSRRGSRARARPAARSSPVTTPSAWRSARSHP